MSRHGFDVVRDLSLPNELMIAGCGAPTQKPLPDPVAAVREALQQPIEYPALRQSVVPGDRVVLALEEGLVQPAPVVTGVVQELMSAGIDPGQIAVIRSARDARLSRLNPTRGLPADLRELVAVHVHDPTDRAELSLLNISSHEDRPIYMNREIVEADVVLPIGVVRPLELLGSLGVHGMLFPTFADKDTQQRFYAPRSTLSRTERRRRLAEAQEAAWMLGVRMVLQLIPGRAETLLHVLAGDAEAVEVRGRELCDEIWQFTVPRRASLVVATMPGGRQQQSWQNFARVLDSALRVVQEDGTIAVCCNLRTKPGPSLRRLARAESLDFGAAGDRT